jgi:homoserine O-acetyltransferase
MNQLLKTIDITRNSDDFETLLSKTTASIHIIGINSDLFFTPKENRETYEELKKFKDNVFYSEIDSVHGHDAFLIEYKQLDHLLADIFKAETIKR